MTQSPFLDADFSEQLATLLSQAHHSGSDVDEALATARRIIDGDADSWVLEWVWTAGNTWAAANAADASRRRQTAAVLYLQAAGYYAAALSQVSGSSEPDRMKALWERQHDCWEHAISSGPAACRRIEIPYEGTSLPGYFFAAPGATARRRPLVIMHNGAHLPTSAMWGLGGAAAGLRGHHWLTFDGPGQQSALFQRGLFLRPDWEVVLSAVVDTVINFPEVDPSRIAAVGIGQAGFWLPRALAYEHRLAAAAVFPGIVDVTSPWNAALTPSLTQLLADGEHAAFDRQVRAALLFDRRTAGRFYWQALPYGLAGASAARVFAEVARYRLTEEPAQISTPMLIAECSGRDHWPEQARELHAQTAADTTLLPGSGDGLSRESQLFDWLEQFLSG